MSNYPAYNAMNACFVKILLKNLQSSAVYDEYKIGQRSYISNQKRTLNNVSRQAFQYPQKWTKITNFRNHKGVAFKVQLINNKHF